MDRALSLAAWRGAASRPRESRWPLYEMAGVDRTPRPRTHGPGTAVKTVAVFFPFDLFGSAGASAGADLLADAFAEMLADNRQERVPTRARAYAGQVRTRQFTFDKLAAYQDW